MEQSVGKVVALLIPGQGEERVMHDIKVLPGTTVLDAVRTTGIENPQHYLLMDEDLNQFVSGQNFYEVAKDGHKYDVIFDEARVAA